MEDNLTPKSNRFKPIIDGCFGFLRLCLRLAKVGLPFLQKKTSAIALYSYSSHEVVAARARNFVERREWCPLPCGDCHDGHNVFLMGQMCSTWRRCQWWGFGLRLSTKLQGTCCGLVPPHHPFGAASSRD